MERETQQAQTQEDLQRLQLIEECDHCGDWFGMSTVLLIEREFICQKCLQDLRDDYEAQLEEDIAYTKSADFW